MDSRDAKIGAIFVIWTIMAMVAWMFTDIEGVVVCHVIWFVLLLVLFNWPPFLRWFHKR